MGDGEHGSTRRFVSGVGRRSRVSRHADMAYSDEIPRRRSGARLGSTHARELADWSASFAAIPPWQPMSPVARVLMVLESAT